MKVLGYLSAAVAAIHCNLAVSQDCSKAYRYEFLPDMSKNAAAAACVSSECAGDYQRMGQEAFQNCCNRKCNPPG
uniref:Uncharacterized protein n=1 Tax=Peronospora matthiolae TaxID=2874970 RepID=A0AAV1UK09_9STRA